MKKIELKEFSVEMCALNIRGICSVTGEGLVRDECYEVMSKNHKGGVYPTGISAIFDGGDLVAVKDNTETEYLELISRITTQGETKSNRTGIDTLVIPPTTIVHDFKDGTFPLFTTKKMAKKSMAVELEGFIGGITSKKWYQDRGCKIWDEWCNPKLIPDLDLDLVENEELMWKACSDTLIKYKVHSSNFTEKVDSYSDSMSLKEKLTKALQFCLDDLGPIYGYQWRAFGIRYEDGLSVSKPMESLGSRELALETGDQFDTMIHTLKSNPDDRRMKVNAWSPRQLGQQALPACHTDFTIQHINGTLHLTWQQRSVDSFYGLPFNLASYSLLLLLICKETGMKAGTVTGFLVDVHLYKNQLEDVQEQLSRPRYPLPKVEIENWDGIYNWKATDLKWVGYQCHGPLRSAEVAV